MIHDHIGGGKAAERLKRCVCMSAYTLTVLEVKFVVYQARRSELMAEVGQAEVQTSSQSSPAPAQRKCGRLRVEKILEGVKSRVVSESRRQIRIARKKGCCGISQFFQHGCQSSLFRRQANHVPPEGERISGSHECGKRIISWRTGHDCISHN